MRLAIGLLTSFPPESVADDDFVAHMGLLQSQWAGRRDPAKRLRASTFIATYEDRLSALSGVRTPCLVMGLQLDTDTFAARAREVAGVIPGAEYMELEGLSHSAPMSDPKRVWPPVIDFLKRNHPPG